MIFPEEYKAYEKLFPLACNWVEEQEALILKKGISLNANQKIDAHLIGIKDIEKVRLLKVERMPTPDNSKLEEAMKTTGLSSPNTIGTAYRYGVYIRADFWENRKLIIHELTHTMQYEKLGSIEVFLKQYLVECFTLGYPNGDLEKEAKKNENEL